MNLPFIGQTYRRNFWRFIPANNGTSTLDFFMTDGRGRIRSGRSSRKVWLLPDGSWSTIDLNPRPGLYLRKWDGTYRPKIKRTVSVRGVRITGKFPNYQTSEGVPVWIDVDGTFSESPIDLDARATERSRDWNRTTPPVTTDFKKPGRYRKVVLRLEAGGYLWRVSKSKREVGKGWEASHGRADMMAARAITVDMQCNDR